MDTNGLYLRSLGVQPYLPVWKAMTRFTNVRNEQTIDELWLVEHKPVYTQGQAGKAEHLLSKTTIPVVQSDRGGQITYHGPGQLTLYPLIDIRRRKLGVRDLVTLLEELVVRWLKQYDIPAYPKPDAPGVYVVGDSGDVKIASLGLRIRRGCSFHGVSININMDLAPFQNINPCGYEGLQMTQLCDLLDKPVPDMDVIGDELALLFAESLRVTSMTNIEQPLSILLETSAN